MQTSVRRLTRVVMLGAHRARRARPARARLAAGEVSTGEVPQSARSTCFRTRSPADRPRCTSKAPRRAVRTVIASRADDLNDPPPRRPKLGRREPATSAAATSPSIPDRREATFTVAGERTLRHRLWQPRGHRGREGAGRAENVQRAQAQALAFTGSNNTTSFVLIGVTALVVGIVLTVGARRRSRISS